MSGHNIDLPEGFEIPDEIADHVHYQIEKCIQKYMNKEKTVNHLLEEFQFDPSLTRTIWESLEVSNPEFFKWFNTQCDVVCELNENLEEINQSGLIDMMRDSTLSDGPMAPAPEFTASSFSRPAIVPSVSASKVDSSELSTMAKRAKEMRKKKRKAKKKEKKLLNQMQLLIQAGEQQQQQQATLASSPATETAPKVQRLSSSTVSQEEDIIDIEGDDDDDKILEEISRITRQLESIVKPVLKLLKNGAGPSRQKASGSRAKTVPKQPSRDQVDNEQKQSGVSGDNQQTEKKQEHDLHAK